MTTHSIDFYNSKGLSCRLALHDIHLTNLLLSLTELIHLCFCLKIMFLNFQSKHKNNFDLKWIQLQSKEYFAKSDQFFCSKTKPIFLCVTCHSHRFLIISVQTSNFKMLSSTCTYHFYFFCHFYLLQRITKQNMKVSHIHQFEKCTNKCSDQFIIMLNKYPRNAFSIFQE